MIGVMFEGVTLTLAAMLSTLTFPRNYNLDPYSPEIVIEYLEVINEPVTKWKYIIKHESNWQLEVKNPSSAAWGLYQIMPITAQELCKDSWKDTWISQTHCAINIRDAQGWMAWQVLH